MPRTYEELFDSDGNSIGDPMPPPRNGHVVAGLNFRKMSSDLAAIRKAERNFKRQHDLLAKDGWTEVEIEELLAEYGQTWATGAIQERARARTNTWPRLHDHLADDHYCGGMDVNGQCWIYDLTRSDERSTPLGLCPVDPLTAAQAPARLNQLTEHTIEAQFTIIAEIMRALEDRYGERLRTYTPPKGRR